MLNKDQILEHYRAQLADRHCQINFVWSPFPVLF